MANRIAVVDRKILRFGQETESSVCVFDIWVASGAAFGAGTSDGRREEFPGLVEMFVLQHYRNLNNSMYTPFILQSYIQRENHTSPKRP